MKTIIAGSRGITDREMVSFHLSLIVPDDLHITEVVSGTAAGVDTLGEQWAEDWDIPVKRFPAEWEKYGKRAGHIRNDEMARYAEACVIFWDGESNGTRDMIQLAAKCGLKLFVFTVKGKR